MMPDIRQQTARDLMTTDVVVIEETDSLDKVTARLLAREVSNAPVVRTEGGKRQLVGFVSEKDLLGCFFNREFYQKPELPIRKCVRINPVCIRPETALPTIACIFLQHNYRHLPVVEDGNFLGIVSRRDALKGFLTFYEEELRHEVKDRQPPELEDTILSSFIIG